MKKVLYSLASVGVIAAIAIGATGAFFSDEETSTDNTFVAGAIDLKVDFESTYNGVESMRWDLMDLTESETFFNFLDLKPGDEGEGTISLHVYNNDAYACVTIDPTMNDDNGSTEPELEVDDPDGDSIFDGELAQNMQFRIWADVCNATTEFPSALVGDNIYQANCDRLLTEGDGPITPRTWALADPTGNVFTVNGPLVGSNNYYLGVAWWIPEEVGNIIQTDKYMADISFYVEQSRNNPTFTCNVSEGFTPNTLRLENEEETQEGPWTVLDGDEIYADLTWDGDGNDFVYDLHAKGLPGTTNYSLIYYADGWPGNHPGALIGEHTTTAGGLIDVDNIVKDLNMDLPSMPDENYAIGAKIWLIPSSAYNGTDSVTTWPPNFDTWLFEGNVYINYQDLDD